MRALIASALVAGVLVVAMFPAIPGYLHPPMCSRVESGGVVVQSFCISWDPALGRYQIPPPGVPADYGARIPSTIDPAVLAALLFVAGSLVLWIGLSIVVRVWRMTRARVQQTVGRDT
jgi:hypothetical protein